RHARGIDTSRSGARACSAERLLIPEGTELVAPGHLPRDTRTGVLKEAVRVRSPARIGCIQPLRRVSGVEVVVHVRAVRRAPAAVRGDEIPQAIPGDRSPDRAGNVVDLAERARRGDTMALQNRCEVVGLELLAGPT